MEEKRSFGQPLMMRKDYGKTEDKDVLMKKSVPIEDYDEPLPKKINKEAYLIEDYDAHRCNKGCFLCDR
jgi:hypothetical protein